jgi:hypothetical protein
LYDSGTFIGDGTAKKYISFSGTWKFERCHIKKEVLLQGNIMVFQYWKKSIMNGF